MSKFKFNIEGYSDTLKKRNGVWAVSYFCDDYGLSCQQLNKLLCKAGILKDTGYIKHRYAINQDFRKYVEDKAFNPDLFKYGEKVFNSTWTPKFTPEGMAKIAEVLNDKFGILPINTLAFGYEYKSINEIKCDADCSYVLILRNNKNSDDKTLYIAYKSTNSEAAKFNYQPLTYDKAKYFKQEMRYSKLAQTKGPRASMKKDPAIYEECLDFMKKNFLENINDKLDEIYAWGKKINVNKYKEVIA